MYLKTPVFVYGTLKRNKDNHQLLRTAEFIGEGLTAVNFTMIHNNSFPIALWEQGMEGKIKGELYKITPHILTHLDALEGVPDMYHRHTVNIFYEKNSSAMCGAFMYVGNPDFWLSRNQLNFIQPNKDGELIWR